MNELIKIKDVSAKYAITARTLRYYEDIGLLTSTRTEDYAHRVYDEAAITRLQQIIILRKLNIRIKDIKCIFDAPDSEVVLDVLGKKADDIDDEVALLHELKSIVLDFIEQIKQSDFHNDVEVKLLYDKAKEIERHLAAADYNGNPGSISGQAAAQTTEPTNASRFLEVTDKLEDKRLTPPIAVNTYRQTLNASRFIGEKYASGGEAWDNWTEDFDADSDKSLVKQLKIDPTKIYTDNNPQDGCAMIGLMRHPDGDHNQFEYWLGFFMPEDTPVPDGYEYSDFPQVDVGVCWLYGKEDDVMAREPVAFEKLKAEGFTPIDNWWFERYVPHRETADSMGYKIMDICFFIKPGKEE
ncbi:MAG: MerR family transcriptional regulator [Defluviitaleaceae bacterium]|nr:MerR family transcriptional regulator [Defluviitaleaceae bacterium]